MAVWIFLRGLTRETAHWGSFPALFQCTLPGTQVIPLDLPGNGTLHQQSSPLSIAAMVDYCRAELPRLGHPPPYHVLAMSMGAMVAAQWACAEPREVAASVLINTSFRPFNPMRERLRPHNYGTVLRMLLTQPSDLTLERAVLRLTSNHPEQHEADIANWVAIRQQRPVRAKNAMRQLVAAARFKASMRGPTSPVLLLGSTQDQLVNVRCTLAIARHWGCPVVLHPDAGHDLPLDDPAWVVQQLGHWLETAHGQ